MHRKHSMIEKNILESFKKLKFLMIFGSRTVMLVRRIKQDLYFINN